MSSVKLKKYGFSISHLRVLAVLVMFSMLYGCAATKPPKPSKGHITAPAENAIEEIPAPVAQSTFVPPPAPAQKTEIYTVVVNEVSVKEMLFALARDASMNVDIHPGIKGKVTLNAVKQSMAQILKRISEQVPIRYRIDGKNLEISPDTPFFRTYKVNYVNMTRESASNVSVATQISSTGSTSGGSGGSNTSQTLVKSSMNNDFWSSLVANVNSIIRQDAVVASKESGNPEGENQVVANPHSGVLTVYGNQRQQGRVQQFLDQVLANVQRQVLIEVTIAEVELSDRYQSGIDWNVLSGNGQVTTSAVSTMTPNSAKTPPGFLLNLGVANTNFDFNLGISMLESFGNTKVLSSPKIIALNNQTALLKVVDEKVYFEVTMDVQEATDNARETKTFTGAIKTVPVGIILAVTPQINENGNVTMNIRPTITRITGYVSDPVPRLQGADFENLIPEIQVREMESLLQVRDGQTVVLGGLMQNKDNKNDRGIPWFAQIPFIGGMFNYKDEELVKTELVVFLRPVITRNSAVASDLQAFQSYLPMESNNIDSNVRLSEKANGAKQ